MKIVTSFVSICYKILENTAIESAAKTSNRSYQNTDPSNTQLEFQHFDQTGKQTETQIRP